MCFYFADVGDIQSRLIDHRPVINSEIRYLVKEFEVLHATLWRLMNWIKIHFIRPKGWTLQHCFCSFRTVAQGLRKMVCLTQWKTLSDYLWWESPVPSHPKGDLLDWDLKSWYQPGWTHADMLFTANFEPTIWVLLLKWGLVRLGALFWSSIVLSWQEGHRVVSCCCSPASPRFQMLAVLHSLVGTSGYLSYCCCTIVCPVS